MESFATLINASGNVSDRPFINETLGTIWYLFYN